MNDYFFETCGIDSDDYEPDFDEDQEPVERHPSLSAEERNAR
jgi:hypothetical protein